MTWSCATRALKNYHFVRASVPTTFPQDAMGELDALSPQTWSALATGANPRELIRHPELANFLLSHPLPRAKRAATKPLFNGTLVFVQFIVDKLSRTGLKIQDSDMGTIIAYAEKAVVPIQQYASQYGFCSVSVDPTFISFRVRVDTDTFTDGQLQRWVDKIIGDNQLQGVGLVFPFNTSFPFPAPLESQDLGYHAITSQGNSYCACSVSGGNLTVRDPNGLYAPVVSHEIAEMVVDPATDGANPEVCDACSGNCDNVHFVGFDAQGQYLGGVKTDQTYPNIDFYIAGIVKPGAIDPQSPHSCALPTRGIDPRHRSPCRWHRRASGPLFRRRSAAGGVRGDLSPSSARDFLAARASRHRRGGRFARFVCGKHRGARFLI